MDQYSCAYIEGNYAYAANCSSEKYYICELTI